MHERCCYWAVIFTTQFHMATELFRIRMILFLYILHYIFCYNFAKVRLECDYLDESILVCNISLAILQKLV